MLSRLGRARADLATMNTLFPAAERIAHDDGRSSSAAEDVLIAGLAIPTDNSGRLALASFNVEVDDVRRALADHHDTALETLGVTADRNAIDALLPTAPDPPKGIYRSEPSAQALFQRVRTLAKADKARLRSGYFLVAASEMEHGTIARTFEHLGIDRGELAAAARRELSVAPVHGCRE